MKPNEELSYDIVNKVQHLLLKNYWLFIFQNLRSRAGWDELCSSHIKEYYTDPQKENSKRTNLPRTFWQRDRLTWGMYYEGLVILKRIYLEMHIELQLVYGNDVCMYKYNIPVSWEAGQYPKAGKNIKHKGRNPNALVVSPDLDRSIEGGLSMVIRELMIRKKLTRGQLDVLVLEYMEEPDNVCTFSGDNTQNNKASITNSMFKWNIQWDMFIRALQVLGYTALGLNVIAKRDNNTTAHALTSMHISG